MPAKIGTGGGSTKRKKKGKGFGDIRGQDVRGKASVGAAPSSPPKSGPPAPGKKSAGPFPERRSPPPPAQRGAGNRPSPGADPNRPSSAFGGRLGKADFRADRKKARDKVRDAQEKVGPRVRLPRLPMLEGGYTDAQRQTIVDMTNEAVREGIRDRRGQPREQSALTKAFSLDNEDGQRRLGDRDTRRALNKLAGAVETQKTDAVRSALKRDDIPRGDAVQIFNDAERQAVAQGAEAKPGKPKTEVAGLPVDTILAAAADRAFSGSGGSARKWARLATAPAQVVKAATEDPGGTAKSSARAAVAGAVGALPGLYRAVTDPKQAAEDTGKAYKRLYEPLMQGNSGEFRRQVKEEGAGIQVAFDTATAAAVGGRIVGAGARAGMLGSQPERLMNGNRPMLRTGAGRDAVRRQGVSGNILKAAAQRGVDANRRRVQRKDARREDGARGLQPAPGRTESEVVKALRPLQRKDQRVGVAKQRARGFVRLSRLQDQEVRSSKTGARGARKDARKGVDGQLFDDLSALVLRGVAPQSVAQARKEFADLRETFVKGRENADRKLAVTPSTDAVAAVDRILAADDTQLQRALDAVNAYKAGEVARDERTLAMDETGLNERQVQRRRRGAQGIAAGVEVPNTKQVERDFKAEKKQAKREVAAQKDRLTSSKRRLDKKERQLERLKGVASTDVARPKRTPLMRQLEREIADETKQVAAAKADLAKARDAERKALADARVDVARPKSSERLRNLSAAERTARADLARLQRSQRAEKRRTSRAEGRAEAKIRQAEGKYLRADKTYRSIENDLKVLNLKKRTQRDAVRIAERTGDPDLPLLRGGLAEIVADSRDLSAQLAQRKRELLKVSPKYAKDAPTEEKYKAQARRAALKPKLDKYRPRAAESRSELAPGRPITAGIVETRSRLASLGEQIAAERKRISGVSPEKADRLLKARFVKDQMVEMERIVREVASEQRRLLGEQMSAEKRRVRGVSPKNADRLRRAIDARDEAAAEVGRQADVLAEKKQALRDLKSTPVEEVVARAEQKMLDEIAKVAQERGWGTGVYVPDRGSSRTDFGAFASGPTAINGWSRTEFERFRQGVFDVTPGAYEEGVARTLKQTVNWNVAADILESNALASGLTLMEAAEFIRRHNLSESDYAAVDMNILRKGAEDVPVERAGDEMASATLADSVKSAIVGKDTLTLRGEDAVFKQKGYSTFIVTTRAVATELEREARAGNMFVRGLQKLQGLTGAWILATSPLFVPIQVASNVGLSVAASRGRVLSAPYRRWRKKIEAQGADPVTLGMIDEYLGNSPLSELSRSPKFGGSSEARMLRFWQTVVDPHLEDVRNSRFNPLTLNRRGDKWQNDVFRRNTFFAKLERDMRAPMAAIAKDAEVLADVLKMAPGPEKEKALRSPASQRALERIAGHVDDALGNWTAYTALERSAGRTAFLFYGFMRFATKLALYHLPVNHPVATNIMLQLGQLNTQEVEDFLTSRFLSDGRYKSYTEQEVRRAIRRELVAQLGGRVYFMHDGEPGYVDLARITPLTSPIFTLLENPRKGALDLMSPALGSTLEALLGERSTGSKLNVNGLYTKFGDDPKMSLGTGVRVVARDFARMNAAVRALDDMLGPADRVQGDDSLPFLNDRPLTPITDRQKDRYERQTEGKAGTAFGRLGQALFTPVRPTDTTSLARVQQATDYPQIDRLKYELDQEKARLQRAGLTDSQKARELRQQIGFLETRAGIRPKKKGRARSSFGGSPSGTGGFGGLGGGKGWGS